MEMNIKQPFSIDIIGGGASAALVLTHLAVHKNTEKIGRITVYDREGRFGRGVAYSTENPLHLLNVRADNMSGFAEEPDHLARWLAAGEYDYSSLDFIPRVVYARYLKELWDEAIETLNRHDCEVSLRKENFNLGQDKRNITVIATGNAFPFLLPGAENLSPADGYHAHPWKIDYKAVKGEIVIAGTGLSMIDSVMALHGTGFTGKITAISRNGLIPGGHELSASWPPIFQDGFPRTIRGLLRKIRTQVKKAGQENIPWQAVIDSIRPDTNRIWQGLNEKERRKFKRVQTFWNIHRHRMAPEAAQTIQSLMGNGTLKIVKDHILRVDKGIIVTGRKTEYRAGCVINCLGYGRDESFNFSPDMESRGIYALGPALLGYYFETTAMPEIRVQAEQIAGKILGA